MDTVRKVHGAAEELLQIGVEKCGERCRGEGGGRGAPKMVSEKPWERPRFNLSRPGNRIDKQDWAVHNSKKNEGEGEPVHKQVLELKKRKNSWRTQKDLESLSQSLEICKKTVWEKKVQSLLKGSDICPKGGEGRENLGLQ